MSGLRSFVSVSCAWALAAVFAIPALAGDVHIVAANGGGNFFEIQDAVDAASEGDTILVKDGTYESFVVGNKSLAIVGDTGADVQIVGAIRGRNLAAGKVLVLQNLTATGVTMPSGVGQHGLYLSDNAGSVRVQDCQFDGAVGTVGVQHRDGWPGARVDASADVAIATSTLRGGVGQFGRLGYTDEPGIAGEGLHAVGSSVAVYGSHLLGGVGSSGNCAQSSFWDGGSGNAGARVESSTLLFSGCGLWGGDGGDACASFGNCFGFTQYGGFAGNGLLVFSNLARVQASPAIGGTPGCDVHSCGYVCYGPVPGRAGAVTDLPSIARTMDAPTPVRERRSPVMSFVGQPGEAVSVFISGRTTNVYRPDWEGTLLVRPKVPHLAMSVGVLPLSGELTMPLPLGDLGPGIESEVLFLQPLFTDAQGNRRLGSPSTMVVVDLAF